MIYFLFLDLLKMQKDFRVRGWKMSLPYYTNITPGLSNYYYYNTMHQHLSKYITFRYVCAVYQFFSLSFRCFGYCKCHRPHLQFQSNFYRTTSDLESFQNHILIYAGKRSAYKYKVYRTRVFLAAIY